MAIDQLFGIGNPPEPAAPVRRDPTQLDPIEEARRRRDLQRVAGLRGIQSTIVQQSPSSPTGGNGLYVPNPIQ